jgi:hypothetical protein
VLDSFDAPRSIEFASQPGGSVLKLTRNLWFTIHGVSPLASWAGSAFGPRPDESGAPGPLVWEIETVKIEAVTHTLRRSWSKWPHVM